MHLTIDHSYSRSPVVSGEGSLADTEATERLESNVRLYCRTFPTVFVTAKDSTMRDEDGRNFLDFFCGAGALNYGHNNDYIKSRLLRYLSEDGITHGLDMYTAAKRDFLERFQRVILSPRGLTHRTQFCGPTGADAVEAALKIARKHTGRDGIVSFMGGFHGMSRGALEVSGRAASEFGSAATTGTTTFLPYEYGPHGAFDSVGLLERMLTDPSAGAQPPAAVIVESVQMEGGVYPASAAWLSALRDVTARHGVLLILDEIQTGCGRTGRFFGFERSGIVPDLVTVSKSISGYGLPLSLLLLLPAIDDDWTPGEHTGTFRANQLALVTASAALDLWTADSFRATTESLAWTLAREANDLPHRHPSLRTRQVGAVLGIDFGHKYASRAAAVQRRCFDDGLIIELSGREDEVVKVMPALTITSAELERGLRILRAAIDLTFAG